MAKSYTECGGWGERERLERTQLRVRQERESEREREEPQHARTAAANVVCYEHSLPYD